MCTYVGGENLIRIWQEPSHFSHKITIKVVQSASYTVE